MEDCAADDRTEVDIRERQFGQRSDDEVVSGQRGSELRGDGFDSTDLVRVHVDAEDLCSAAHQVMGVAASTASRIQHPHLRPDPSAEQLVEEVDIDIAEVSDELIATTGWIGS